MINHTTYEECYEDFMKWVSEWVGIPENTDLISLSVHLDRDGQITVNPKFRFIKGME